VSETGRLTYGERVDRLAGSLRGADVVPVWLAALTRPAGSSGTETTAAVIEQTGDET
jgi:hypothetical protein